MNGIEYICLDLDGTLLDSKKIIGAESKRIIKTLRDKGKKILLASGRHLSETIAYYKELELEHNDIVISCDGQYIYQCDGTLIWSAPFLDSNDLLEIKRQTTPYSMSIITDKQDFKYVSSFRDYLMGKLKRLFRRGSVSVVRNNMEAVCRNLKIEKVILREVKQSVLSELSQSYSVHCINTDYQRVEILRYGVNKYIAIEMLKQKGLINNLDNLVYFGNDMNDEECFNHLKNCVAMGDSPDSLKSKAVMITADCNHDGVAQALLKLFY